MMQMITRTPPRFVTSVRALLVAASLAATEALPAQVLLRGRVIDSETGTAIAGARVTFNRGVRDATANEEGQFTVPGLAPGEQKVNVQAIGFAPRSIVIVIPDTGVVERTISLEFTGDKLPAVAVQARAEQLMARYNEFETRRARGNGAFLRWDELAKKNFGTVGDALRTVRGVRIMCDQQSFECIARMVRTPGCEPVWVIDGTEAKSFHENTPVRDVYGIEIYRGPGEIPGEYTGSNAACGVIVMWTKSRPYRVDP